MIKILILLLVCHFSTTAIAQDKDFSAELSSYIKAKKKLDLPEKTKIRIKLRAEVSSVGTTDEKNTKKDEIQKSLFNATVLSSFQNDKDFENTLKLLWKQFFALNKSEALVFKNKNLNEALDDMGGGITQQIELINYLLSVASPDVNEYFHPAVRLKCNNLAYLRKTAELEQCWQIESTYSKGSVELGLDIMRKRLQYYLFAPELSKKFEATLNQLMSDKKNKKLHLFGKILSIGMKINKGELEGVDKDIKALAAEYPGNMLVERMRLRYLVSIKKIDEAEKVFNSLPQEGLNEENQILYNNQAANLYLEKSDFEKVDSFFKKSFELEKLPLDKMNANLMRLALARVLKNNSELARMKSDFSEYEKIIQNDKITDRRYLSYKNIGLILLKDKVDLKLFEEALVELKKHSYVNVLENRVLDSVLKKLKETK